MAFQGRAAPGGETLTDACGREAAGVLTKVYVIPSPVLFMLWKAVCTFLPPVSSQVFPE